MHRFAKIDPQEHTRRIIEAAQPQGRALDVCTGLGYTAIAAAKKSEVKQVTTIENDAEVLALCKINGASAALFKNPKIKILEGDAAQKIAEFSEWSFDSIIHDPPTFIVAPELYTREFCSALFRVLKKGGRLWFYAAMPGKAGSGTSKLPERIMKYLKLAGFSQIMHDENSTGVICIKNA